MLLSAWDCGAGVNRGWGTCDSSVSVALLFHRLQVNMWSPDKDRNDKVQPGNDSDSAYGFRVQVTWCLLQLIPRSYLTFVVEEPRQGPCLRGLGKKFQLQV